MCMGIHEVKDFRHGSTRDNIAYQKLKFIFHNFLKIKMMLLGIPSTKIDRVIKEGNWGRKFNTSARRVSLKPLLVWENWVPK